MDSLLAQIQAWLSTGFWQVHGTWVGIILVIGALHFPRVMVLFITPIPYGRGYLFALFFVWVQYPRFALAILMSVAHLKTNPWLCLLLWLHAIFVSGYDLEKKLVNTCFRALSDNWDDIKDLLAFPAKIFALIVSIIVLILICLTAVLGAAANAIIFTIGLVLLSGSGLYFFRQKKKFWYGVFEIIVALFISGYTIWRAYHFEIPSTVQFVTSSDFFATLVGLMSSVYIVVRGLDNLGAEEEVKKLLSKLKSLRSELKDLLYGSG
jgi:LPXTG-motif cell wall-anchored protein